jgi:fatty acid synthase subunit alpha
MMQVLADALVPGNFNADNIAPELRKNAHLFFPSKPIQHVKLEAGMITSFGFGQVGGDCLILHPRHLFAALDPAHFAAYAAKRAPRARKSYLYSSEALITNSLVRIKEHPQYTPEQELDVLLNPLARTSLDKKGEYSVASKLPTALPKAANHGALQLALKNPAVAGVGVDTELISEFPYWNQAFVEKNFTPLEIAHCSKQPSPQASFAGRWAAKEAAFKAMGVESKGAAAQLKDIEIKCVPLSARSCQLPSVLETDPPPPTCAGLPRPAPSSSSRPSSRRRTAPRRSTSRSRTTRSLPRTSSAAGRPCLFRFIADRRFSPLRSAYAVMTSA